MNRPTKLALVAAAAILLLACDPATAYHHYNPTPIAGWEKNDTLIYDVPPLRSDGVYRQEVGLRINDAFPFTSLRLIVEQQRLPAGTVRRDTLDCPLTDHEGTPLGQGVSYYQYSFPIATRQLRRGDSLHVSIRHDMKREILPGIADVGFKMTCRTPATP